MRNSTDRDSCPTGSPPDTDRSTHPCHSAYITGQCGEACRIRCRQRPCSPVESFPPSRTLEIAFAAFGLGKSFSQVVRCRVCEATALRADPNFFGVLAAAPRAKGIGHSMPILRFLSNLSGQKNCRVSCDLTSPFNPASNPCWKKLQFTLRFCGPKHSANVDLFSCGLAKSALEPLTKAITIKARD